jgi:hypothetical protein
MVHKTGPMGPFGPQFSFSTGFVGQLVGRCVGRFGPVLRETVPRNRPTFAAILREWDGWDGFVQGRKVLGFQSQIDHGCPPCDLRVTATNGVQEACLIRPQQLLLATFNERVV